MGKEWVLPIRLQPCYSETKITDDDRVPSEWKNSFDSDTDSESAFELPQHEIKHVLLSDNQLLMAELEVDLTPYTYDNYKLNGKSVIGRLTGFLSRTNSGTHFVSITKGLREDDDCFYLSDDLHPDNPQNLGSEPTNFWPKPYLMFYTVCVVENGTSEERFPLPFYPPLNDEMIAKAASTVVHINQDYIDIKKDSLICNDASLGNPNFRHTSTEVYVAAPIFYLKDGRLVETVPGVECNYQLRYGSKKHRLPITFNSIRTLLKDQFVNDEVINAFVSMFNKSELEKWRKDKSYKPSHMMDTHFITTLCGRVAKDKLYQKTDADKHTHSKRYVRRFGAVRQKLEKCGLDLFRCSNIIIPVNEGPNTHWTFFVIDPLTLQQRFFCSMHYIRSNERLVRSRCLHKWIIHQHRLRYDSAHQNSTLKWATSLLEDRPTILLNTHQFGVDCALHICAVPMLIANGMNISVFGITDNERMLAGHEMRYRMVLSILNNENWFRTSPEGDEIEYCNIATNGKVKHQKTLIQSKMDSHINNNNNVNKDKMLDTKEPLTSEVMLTQSKQRTREERKVELKKLRKDLTPPPKKKKKRM